MQVKLRSRRSARNKKGGAQLSELGPAFMVLLICFFFPMLDMLDVAVAYAMCLVLNYNQCHEASLVPFQQATDVSGSVMKDIPDQWMKGMGAFLKLTESPKTAIVYRPGQASKDSGNNNVQDVIVRVQTTIVCSPLVPVPLPSTIAKIPGLNGPMTLSSASERPMENPDFAP